MPTKRTARAVALLIVLNAHEYGKEREREITQYRFSAATLRRLSDRSRLREAFLVELEDELRAIGWVMVWRNEIEFGVFQVLKLDGWAKLTSKRVKQYADSYSEDDLEKLYEETSAAELNAAEDD